MKEFRVVRVNRYIVLESDRSSVREVCEPCTLKMANKIAIAFGQSDPDAKLILGGKEMSVGFDVAIDSTSDPRVSVATHPIKYSVHGGEDYPEGHTEQYVAVKLSRLAELQSET